MPRADRRAILAGVAALALANVPAKAQERVGVRVVEPESGWERVGDFRGSPGSGFVARLRNELFELDSSGSLYRDLGDVSLGVSFDVGKGGRVDWDNTANRQVLAYHEDLLPGGTIGTEDLSRYLDVKTLVSRGRADYRYVPDWISDGGAGVRVEGGTSLTLAHIHDPLPLGERPLAAALAEAGPESISRELRRELRNSGRRVGDPSVLEIGTRGVAAIVRWIADAIGKKNFDTERSAIFWEGYADPITQIVDLGVPVEAEIFFAGSPLAIGDRVRHITFLAVVPVDLRAKKLGMETGYQRYVRFLRETTIVKQAGNEVVVVVRNGLASGNELIPFKIRPELRLLKILRLGYTFFEQIYDRAGTISWQVAYRVDLSNPHGLAAFRLLLEQGNNVRFRPLADAADRGDGAEILYEESRDGRQRSAVRRAQFFSAASKRGSRTARLETIRIGPVSLRQVARLRSSRLKKTWGRDRNRERLFAVSAQSHLTSVEDRRENGWDGALTLISGLRDVHAESAEVKRAGRLLEVVNPSLDLAPLVAEMSDLGPRGETRLLVNSFLSLSGKHLAYLAGVSPDRVWQELGEIFLGAGRGGEWSTPPQRRIWRRSVGEPAALRRSLPALPIPVRSGKALGPRRRYRLARRTARKFERLQELIRERDCLPCLTDALDEWRDVAAMHVLLARLGADGGLAEPGYRYEVYSDAMLRPATLSNGIRYSFPTEDDLVPDLVRFKGSANGSDEDAVPAGAARLQQEIDRRRDWIGTATLAESSASRLAAGMMLARNRDAGSPSGTCFQLRLFSDHQFHPALRLRTDLHRVDGGHEVDHSIETRLFRLGAPVAVAQTPFMVARYYFDVPLPALRGLEEGSRWEMQLRVLNPAGYPVTEEQQLRFQVAEGGEDLMPPGCVAPAEPSPPSLSARH